VSCSQDEPDYKAMHRDLEKELEHVRKEGEEHIRLLNQESAKVKEAASAARAEAARMRNEADFERERGQRLQEQLRDLHQQVEALTQSNTKYQVCSPFHRYFPKHRYPKKASKTARVLTILSVWIVPERSLVPVPQVLVIELQQRLSNLDTELGTQRDKARQMEARANFLENEKALLTAAEQRLVRTVEGLSTEKHKLSAQLQVEQKVCKSFKCSFGIARCM
jgi:chromosome segregation ATPase